MQLKKIEINGSDGNMNDYFLQNETAIGHLFIMSSSFGKSVNDVKAEEFIANEIYENIVQSEETDSFQVIQNSIIQTNEKLMEMNIFGSVLILLIGKTESWCIYVGSNFLNVSVKRDNTPYKKLFSSETLIKQGAMKSCLGFKRIVPLEKVVKETSRTEADGKVITTRKTILAPIKNFNFDFDSNSDYLVSYKKLNVVDNNKSDTIKYRLLMCNSDFNKAFQIKVREGLLNNADDLSKIKSLYLQHINTHIVGCNFNNRKYKSILGVLVEMGG